MFIPKYSITAVPVVLNVTGKRISYPSKEVNTGDWGIRVYRNLVALSFNFIVNFVKTVATVEIHYSAGGAVLMATDGKNARRGKGQETEGFGTTGSG